MKERLAQFLKNEGLTAVKFAEIMEVQPSSISHLLSGRNKPNFDFISRMLLRFPELNPDWIINGKEGIYKSKITEPHELFTNVNVEHVTDVKEDKRNQEVQEMKDISPDLDFHFNNQTSFNTDNSQVTDVNSGQSSSPENTVHTSVESHRKSIRRVIIFFTDGSFEEYN